MAGFMDMFKNPTDNQPAISVIKNEAYGDNLCYVYPREDFNTGSQLVVTEYEEAFFVQDGIIEQIFGAGRYTLTTENYPFLTRLVKKFVTGGVSPFSCKVVFVNKAHHLELKWGTGEPIHVIDPVWGIEVQVQARGSYSIVVSDSKKFYVKMIGAYGAASQDDVVKNFKTAFRQHFTDALADYLTSSGQEILMVLNKKKALADSLEAELNGILDEYGIRLVNFYIENISVPEDDDSMNRIREMRIKRQENQFQREQSAADTRLQYGLQMEGADTERYVSGQAAQADYERMKIRDQDGNNGWARQEASELLKMTAQNESTPGMFSQIGMGIGAAQAVSGMMRTAFQGGDFNASMNINQAPGGNAAPGMICPKCSAAIPEGMKFCGTCGTPVAAPSGVTCPTCGAMVPAGMKFCGACGTQLMTSRICSGCGNEVPAGMKFCGVCGKSI